MEYIYIYTCKKNVSLSFSRSLSLSLSLYIYIYIYIRPPPPLPRAACRVTTWRALETLSFPWEKQCFSMWEANATLQIHGKKSCVFLVRLTLQV